MQANDGLHFCLGKRVGTSSAADADRLAVDDSDNRPHTNEPHVAMYEQVLEGVGTVPDAVQPPPSTVSRIRRVRELNSLIAHASD